MMKQISINWAGEEYIIPEKHVFELGERIEDIISLSELSKLAESPNFRRIARCYAEMINFAGGHVTAQEIHSAMMAQLKGASDDDRMTVITAAVSTLLEILMDGAPEELMGDGDAGKKTQGAASVS